MGESAHETPQNAPRISATFKHGLFTVSLKLLLLVIAQNNVQSVVPRPLGPCPGPRRPGESPAFRVGSGRGDVVETRDDRDTPARLPRRVGAVGKVPSPLGAEDIGGPPRPLRPRPEP